MWFKRKPKGVPDGGQFAVQDRVESTITLTDPEPTPAEPVAFTALALRRAAGSLEMAQLWDVDIDFRDGGRMAAVEAASRARTNPDVDWSQVDPQVIEALDALSDEDRMRREPSAVRAVAQRALDTLA